MPYVGCLQAQVAAQGHACPHVRYSPGFLFKPRGVVHALRNPTDSDAIVMEFISPAGFEGFFGEMGALQAGASPEIVREIANRYGQTRHPELSAELSELYDVSV